MTILSRLVLIGLASGLLAAACTADRAVEVDVRATLPLGIVHLLQSMAGEPGFIPDAAAELSRQRPFTEEEKARLSKVRRLLFQESGRGGRSLPSRLREEAYLHETVPAFLAALELRLSTERFAIVEDAVLSVAEDYESLIWEPARARLAEEKRIIQEQFDSPEGSTLFEQALAFYPDSPQRSFRVGLVPLTPVVSHGSGSAALPLPEGVLYQVSARPMRERAGGVVFHEIVHLLQKRTDQDALMDSFSKGGSTQAGIESNEAVATVLGNYLFTLRVTGTAPRGTLYTDPYVEGYARALIPVIENYLARGRQFDDAFVRKAVVAYETAYPDRLDDPAYVFRHFILAGVDEGLLPIGLGARLQPGPARSFQGLFPLTDEQRSSLEDNTLTRVFVLTPDQLPAVSELISLDGRAALKGVSQGVWAQKHDDRWSFFVVGPPDDPEEWVGLLRGLVLQSRLREGLLEETVLRN